MSDIGQLLREIRGKDTLRTAAKKTGLSHGYISILEKGVDPRTGSPIKASPDTLRSYSSGYKYPFKELMRVAGYSEKEQVSSTEEVLDANERRVIEVYSKLPPHKRKLLDDLVEVLANESQE